MSTRDTMLEIARKAILHRASLDGYAPEDYDAAKDDEGYVVSLLTAVHHWCHVYGIDWRADVERAEFLFAEDLDELETAQ